MLKNISNVTNPISANQVVDVQLDWLCLTAPTCINLQTSLQTIVDALCKIQNPELEYGTLVPDSDNIVDVLQALINKCNETTTNTTETVEEVWDLNECLTDNWDCGSENNCVIPTNDCGEVTNVDYVQAILSRLVSQGAVIKELCTTIESLQTQINDLKIEVENGCC